MRVIPLGIIVRLCLLGVIAAAPVYMLLANFASFEPYLLPLHAIQAGVRQATPNVIVGPYPDANTLMALHQRGVGVVISLLDENLIYEKSLIQREDALAATLGIREVNAPMDSSQPPTSPLNAAALAKIRAYIGSHHGTQIYVHCYLGKHRAHQVELMLQRQNTKVHGTR